MNDTKLYGPMIIFPMVHLQSPALANQAVLCWVSSSRRTLCSSATLQGASAASLTQSFSGSSFSCGNITRAADKLYISQPALSQTIKRIEHEMGVQLFQRFNGRLRLTDEGNCFVSAGIRINKELLIYWNLSAGCAKTALSPQVSASTKNCGIWKTIFRTYSC